MRAMAIQGFGPPEELRPTDLPRPRPERGEILLRVVAAGVNPVDAGIRAGRFREIWPHAFPLVPGWDVAGVVETLGEQTTRFRRGDRVWACAKKPAVQWGAYAEFVAVPESQAAQMPAKLLYEEAAVVPCAGLTAAQCLDGVGPGDRVLVHGAAGGVGHFAVQLARAAGARVLATASSRNHEFVMRLGAIAVIDYSREDFAEAVQRHEPEGLDLVLDSVGGETGRRSLGVLRPGGRLVSIVDPPDEAQAQALGVAAYMRVMEPDAERLAELGRLIDGKQLRPEVQSILDLAAAADAHRLIEEGHVRGKLVLNL